ncbi:hypothetical protein BX661DRAFT_223646 [Kickxella alabastrina]|uniref:uncharacterized protein n=1 Tax=Kickxella alabastrina TaxID=61397 RepID=UPI00221EF5DB|nr:uncharacterized protein BX661DRAFT_223646 [Kickxella alabastrina]KAI7830847.1 hypothetical protein BX661DRAFT_223646 [Kickxella alabastrina]
MSLSNEEVNKIELYAVEGVVNTNNSDDIVELNCDDIKSSSDIELLGMVVSKLSDNEEVIISNKDSVIEPIAGMSKKGKYVDTTARLGVVFAMGIGNETLGAEKVSVDTDNSNSEGDKNRLSEGLATVVSMACPSKLFGSTEAAKPNGVGETGGKFRFFANEESADGVGRKNTTTEGCPDVSLASAGSRLRDNNPMNRGGRKFGCGVS